jgi:glycosyltransferase involved in cell wall biosynthesis
MRSVRRIILLYPGKITSRRISNPGNYALSRLLIRLYEAGRPPIYFLNRSPTYERWGNIELIHFTKRNFLKVAAQCAFRPKTLIIGQSEVFHKYARLLRTILPRSRVVVRLGGTYFGKEYVESLAFRARSRALRRRLLVADMIISTAEGTPVDLYMEKLGIPKERYRRWLNGFPVIPNLQQRIRTNQVLCISRLSHEKGVDYVIRSFARALPHLLEPHKLTVLGDGAERSSLMALTRELGIDANVEFVGNSDDVGPYLYSSRLLVVGLANNPIMEAIATQTPVIALELGELKSMYGRYPGVHIVDYPPGGYGRIQAPYVDQVTRETANKIVELLNVRSMSDDVITAPTEPLFSWDQRLQAELDLYEDLLARS